MLAVFEDLTVDLCHPPPCIIPQILVGNMAQPGSRRPFQPKRVIQPSKTLARVLRSEKRFPSRHQKALEMLALSCFPHKDAIAVFPNGFWMI